MEETLAEAEELLEDMEIVVEVVEIKTNEDATFVVLLIIMLRIDLAELFVLIQTQQFMQNGEALFPS